MNHDTLKQIILAIQQGASEIVLTAICAHNKKALNFLLNFTLPFLVVLDTYHFLKLGGVFPLTVEINLSAVHLCMRSPILTSTVLGIGTAGVYSPSTGSTWCDKLWKHRSWKSFFCHFFSGRYLLGMWCCTLRNPTPFYILNYGPHLSQFGQMQFLNLNTSHYLIVNLPIFKSLTEFPLLTHTSNPPISSWKSSVIEP